MGHLYCDKSNKIWQTIIYMAGASNNICSVCAWLHTADENTMTGEHQAPNKFLSTSLTVIQRFLLINV